MSDLKTIINNTSHEIQDLLKDDPDNFNGELDKILRIYGLTVSIGILESILKASPSGTDFYKQIKKSIKHANNLIEANKKS